LIAALLKRSNKSMTKGLWVSSGEVALTVALRLLGQQHPTRRQVVAPDFICPSVPRAICAAGFEPLLVSIDPSTWFYRQSDLEAAVTTDTAAVVLVSHHGMIPLLPDWFDPLLDRYGVAALADWAPCFGVEIRPYGRAALAVFSFGPGKSLPAGGGGLIVPLTDEGRTLLAATPSVGAASPAKAALHLIRLLAQALVTGGAIWPLLPRSFVESAAGDVEAKRPVGPLPAWVSRYAANAGSVVSRDLERRRAVCAELGLALSGIDSLVLPPVAFLENGACIRYPVLLRSSDLFERVRGALVREGLLKGSYRWNMHAAQPSGSDIARRLLTLPTHCADRLVLNRIVKCISAAVSA
jgi:DegT/DnrJ/EryC1/StrS aminotransferase family